MGWTLVKADLFRRPLRRRLRMPRFAPVLARLSGDDSRWNTKTDNRQAIGTPYCATMAYWEPEDFDEMALKGMASLGTSVRAARVALGISQHELGWRVGLSQATISRLESGRLRGLRLRKLAAIAGVVRFAPRLFVPGAPPPPTRRLPGAARPRD